jgi:hypothetical protein
MKTDSQNMQLAKWLKSGRSIAPLQALNQLGIYRLASRCHDLRNQGMNIESKMMYIGKGIKFAQYKLVKK